MLRFLDKDYGWLDSLKKGYAVNRDGAAIPWFTYSAIEWLNTLDLSEKRIFEYGCGQSTYYWAARAKELIAVERTPEWYEHIQKATAENVTLVLEEDHDKYVRAIEKFAQKKFDIIVVDDIRRGECITLACKHIADGGMIILDNSDRYEGIHKFMQDQGFVRFDFVGVAPAISWVNATSCYVKFNFTFKQTNKIEAPGSGVQGSWKDIIDDDLP